MKKRIISLLLCASMISTLLTACGSSNSSSGTSKDTSSEGTQSTASNTSSDGNIVIIMGHEGNDDLADGLMSLKFNELIAEKSNGRITVDYKSNGTLGDEDELLQQVINGSIQATCVSTSTYSNYTSELDALQLPFLYKDYEIEHTALKSDAARALYADMESLGVKITDVTEIGFRHFANNKKPITCLADLSGIKMRIVSSALLTDVAKSLNMESTPVAYSEIYSALQSGVVDGEEINLISIVSNSHQEVLKYVSLIGFYSFPSALTFNLNWFNSLSAEDQALIEECSSEAMDYAMDQCEQIEADSLKTIEDAGIQVNTIGESEKQEFIDACQSVYDTYEGKSEHIKAYVDYVNSL